MQYHEALFLVEAERFCHGKRLPELEILGAGLRWTLGDREAALAVFARYGEQIKPEGEAAWHESLIATEARLDLRDQARRHAASVLAQTKDQAKAHRLLAKLFQESSESAELWFDYLRARDASRDPADVLKLVDAIVGGKLASQQFKELLEGVQADQKAGKYSPELAEQWTLTMADAALAAGEDAIARSVLEKATTSSAALQKLGDLSADKKQWEPAADYYRRASEADSRKALPLFLWGHALARAGHEKQGRQRMEQSHWLPFGSSEARHAFASALARRNHTEASRREFHLLLQSSAPASYQAGEAHQREAGDARARQDFLLSAAAEERGMLRCLRNTCTFVESRLYVSVPATIHYRRARGFAAAGRLDEALREAATCLDDVPQNLDIPIQLVPQLEKAGRHAEAAAIFTRALGLLEATSREFANSAAAHNATAWLSACCRRNLDEALDHARKAIALQPEDTSFHDTLAEVLFQLGRKEQAVAAERKAVALDPKNPYYRRQLARIEAGDPLAPRPPNDDED
jgi:tetratricopeptide (TPR) repeat protein